jgi:hypothetical protein
MIQIFRNYTFQHKGGGISNLYVQYTVCMLMVLALRGCYSMEEEYCKRRKVDRAY